MGKLNINKKLLPLKGHFFTFNAGTAPIVPFMPTYAKQLGISATTVGKIYTVLTISGLLAKPLFGALADKFRIQKLLFILSQILTALAFFGINFIPNSANESKVLLKCGETGTVFDTCVYNKTASNNCSRTNINFLGNMEVECKLHCSFTNQNDWNSICENWNIMDYCAQSYDKYLEFNAFVLTNETVQLEDCVSFQLDYVTFNDSIKRSPYCTKSDVSSNITSICDVSCQYAPIMKIVSRPKENDNTWGMYQFWLFVMLMIFSWVGMAVVVSVGDAICFAILADKPNNYGYQRLFGSIGWGLFSIIAGLSVDYFSRGEVNKNYTPVFYLMLFMLGIDIVISSQLKFNQTTQSLNILKDVGKLLSDLRIIVFVMWCIIVGLSTGIQWQYLFWHLENLASENCDTVNNIKTLEGLVMGIQCFGGELPFFFLSGLILKKIGHVNTMSLVLSGFGVRFILYSFLKNPWWCLPIELLNGVTFGLFYSTMASYASIIAPLGTEATIQGLVGAIFEGVGVSLGSLIGGYLFHSYGGALTFRVFGIVSLIGCVLHVLVQCFLKQKHANHHSLKGY